MTLPQDIYEAETKEKQEAPEATSGCKAITYYFSSPFPALVRLPLPLFSIPASINDSFYLFAQQ